MAPLPELNVKTVYTTNVALTGAPPAAQGYTPANGDVVLLAAQTATTENGPYTVNTSGAWSRHTDFDLAAEFVPNSRFYPTHGTLAGSEWYFANSEVPTLGTTPINIVRRAHPLAVEPGARLTRVGNVIGMPTNPNITEAVYSFPTIGISDEGVITSVEPATVFTALMEGLRLRYGSTNSFTVEAGQAWVPGLDRLAALEDDKLKSGLVLSASTTYYVYLYEPSVGVADVEIVTQAPATTPYLHFARVKGPDATPDDTRRWLGQFSTNASSQIISNSVISAEDAYWSKTTERSKTTTQSIATATWATVLFDNSLKQTLAASYAAGVWTILVAGTYALFFDGGWASDSTGARLARFLVNGSGVYGAVKFPASGASELFTTAITSLNANDTVEMQVHQTSGVALNLSAGAHASITKLAE